MLTRHQLEKHACVQMLFLQDYCVGRMPPETLRKFELMCLLVGARLDMRMLCDESLEWISTLYFDPVMTPLTRF